MNELNALLKLQYQQHSMSVQYVQADLTEDRLTQMTKQTEQMPTLHLKIFPLKLSFIACISLVYISYNQEWVIFVQASACNVT